MKAKNYIETSVRCTVTARPSTARRVFSVLICTLFSMIAGPASAFASVENMMSNLQSAILNVLAPMVCVGGIIFAGFKLAMGDESAKKMLFWACVGTVVSFTAPSILAFLQTRVAS